MATIIEHYKKAKENLVYHLIDSTGLLFESTPAYAAMETSRWVGMPDDISMNARLIAAGLTYVGGMGIAYSKGRDFYRKTFGITAKAKEIVQAPNDAVYNGLFNLVGGPFIYLIAGSRNLNEIAMGTALGIVLGIVNGFPLGYSADVFRDLAGLKECERPLYPKFLKRQNSKIKKGLAALLVASSIALTAGIYALTPDKQTINYQQQTIQQVIDTGNSH